MRKLLLLSVLTLAFSNICFAAGPSIKDIVVEGNSRVDAETILLQVSSQKGKKLNKQTVSTDIIEIYRMGHFEDVKAILRKDGGRSVLVFVLREKPGIRNIYINGYDELGEDTVKEKLNIGARKYLDRSKINAGIKELETYYRSLGYYETEIEFDVEEISSNQVDLTFDITEGEKKVLDSIVFEGNKQLDDDDLEDVISTSTYSWYSSWLTGSGVVKDEQLEHDVRAITHHYLTNGFADVRLGQPVVEPTEDGLKLTFKIEEGEKFAFGDILVDGDLLEESEEVTLDGISAVKGETFNVDILRKDSFFVSEKFTDIGYAFANVDPVTNINRSDKQVQVTFAINKGELITINRVNITGNAKTRDNVIRRSLKVHERELYSSSKIKRSEKLLRRLGYFDEVTITPESANKENEVDLTVGVREGSTGSFSAGAGFSSGDGLLMNTRVSENNLFGYGYNVTVNIDLGDRNENVVLSFDDPRWNDTNWSFGFDILKVEREFDDFDREQKGISTTVGYPLVFLGPKYLDDVRFSLKYEFLDIDISNVEADAPDLIKNEEGTSSASGITPRIVRNTIDNPLNPTSGSRQLFSIETTGLGGSEEYILGRFNNTFYYPLFDTQIGPIVFSQRMRLGYGETFDGDDFPLFRRFFPGGINSVRGFDNRELGPKDEDGDEFGGSKEIIGNFEFIFPLFSNLGLKMVTFYDMGNAFDDDQSIDFGDLRHAAGWGIRWNSPLGPIRIEIGYPLDKEEGEDSSVTHFSFGAPL